MSKCNTAKAPLGPEQIERIVEQTEEGAAREIHTAAMLAAYTGLRLGEIAGIRWQDVDFNNNSLRIVSAKDRHVQIVLMPPAIAEFLKKLSLEREQADEIFHHPLPWLVCRLNRALRKACLRLGLPRINAHDLRRSFVCNLPPRKP